MIAKKSKSAMHVSGLSVLLLISAACSMTHAQETAAPQVPQVGVTDAPCAHLEPPPAEAKAFLLAYMQAKAEGKPLPIPTAAGLARYKQWQDRVLLQDFGGKCKYEAENSGLAAKQGKRTVFFGDSITENWMKYDPTFFNAEKIDRGISGQTTSQMLVRFRQDVIDLHPDTVHILAGVNDIAGNTGPSSLPWIESNITSMVEQAKSHHIRVVLATVLPAASIPWRPEVQPVAAIAALNTWLAGYAEKEHLTLVDYFTALKDEKSGLPSKYTEDGVHPNVAGYKVMEPLAEKALSK